MKHLPPNCTGEGEYLDALVALEHPNTHLHLCNLKPNTTGEGEYLVALVALEQPNTHLHLWYLAHIALIFKSAQAVSNKILHGVGINSPNTFSLHHLHPEVYILTKN